VEPPTKKGGMVVSMADVIVEEAGLLLVSNKKQCGVRATKNEGTMLTDEGTHGESKKGVRRPETK